VKEQNDKPGQAEESIGIADLSTSLRFHLSKNSSSEARRLISLPKEVSYTWWTPFDFRKPGTT
jgi:hypothetical protein